MLLRHNLSVCTKFRRLSAQLLTNAAEADIVKITMSCWISVLSETGTTEWDSGAELTGCCAVTAAEQGKAKVPITVNRHFTICNVNLFSDNVEEAVKACHIKNIHDGLIDICECQGAADLIELFLGIDQHAQTCL